MLNTAHSRRASRECPVRTRVPWSFDRLARRCLFLRDLYDQSDSRSRRNDPDNQAGSEPRMGSVVWGEWVVYDLVILHC